MIIRHALLFLFPLACLAQNASPVCPVSIASLESSSNLKAGLLAAMAGSSSSNTWLILKYRNNSPQTVLGVRFSVVYFNSVGEAFPPDTLTTPSLKLKPGKVSGMIRPDENITAGRKVAVGGWVERVLFANGEAWQDDGRRSCSRY